jgi:putative transposase
VPDTYPPLVSPGLTPGAREHERGFRFVLHEFDDGFRCVVDDSISRMSGDRVSGHRSYQMYAHVIWSTWQRTGCIDRPTAKDIGQAMMVAADRAGIRILRSAILADHVHVVLSLRPDTRVSDFLRVAKSGSAFMANRRVTGQLKWSRGAHVSTYHRHDLARLVGYVAEQYARHPDRIPRERGH